MLARFESELWLQGKWYLMSLPLDFAEEIRAVPRPPAPGFGSLHVSVTIGSSTWKTSIFPDSTTGGYVLPVKRAVREAEGIELGEATMVELEVLD